MANGMEVNVSKLWFEGVYQEMESIFGPVHLRVQVQLLGKIRDRLLSGELPSEINSVEGLAKLKQAIEDRDPRVADHLEGLVDDLAACVQGKPGAELALAIRKQDIEQVMEVCSLPDNPNAYQRVWRAILENFDVEDTEVFEKFREQLLSIPAESLAAVVNRYRFPLENLRDLVGTQADVTLRKLAPHLSYADLEGLDSVLQRDLLDLCTPEKLTHLTICSDEIEELPAGMVALERLECTFCEKLVGLPEGMTNLKDLECSECFELASLPSTMPALEKLDCDNCFRLESLPAGMGALKALSCEACINLATLPADMDSLKRLDCRGCSQLICLPAGMTKLKELDCRKCSSLTSLPAGLGALQELVCKKCVRLGNLPAALPHCTSLDFSRCPLLVNTPTPEVPANATVYRAVAGNQEAQEGTWQVPYDEVQSNPLAFLCQLGDWLLKGRPFPNVAYLENDGQPFRGVDMGGVRRDLVARILNSLFQSDLEAGKGLLLKCQSLLPLWRNEDPTQEQAYRTLGRLMALSYQHVCDLATGPLFSKGFYKALLSEDGSLWRIAALQGIDFELIRMITGQDPIEIGDLKTKTKEHIWSYLDPKMERFTEENYEDRLNSAAEYFKDHREELERAILKDKVLLVQQNRVVECVRKELEEALGEDEWKEIQKKGAGRLQKEIEGELSSEALLNRLDWTFELSSEEEVEQTQKYFHAWLHQASEKDLQTLVRAVTGNRSLTAKHVTVQLYKMEAKIPVAHSCFSYLDLSSQFPDQQTLNDKMKLFLDNALVGSGFQLA